MAHIYGQTTAMREQYSTSDVSRPQPTSGHDAPFSQPERPQKTVLRRHDSAGVPRKLKISMEFVEISMEFSKISVEFLKIPLIF